MKFLNLIYPRDSWTLNYGTVMKGFVSVLGFKIFCFALLSAGSDIFPFFLNRT